MGPRVAFAASLARVRPDRLKNFMPQIEFRPVNRVRPDCAWLLRHRANVTSQIGQDGILAKIFEIIGPGARY